MVVILDGKSLADAVRAKVKERVAAMEIKPGLAVLLVGDDPASHLYVGLKEKACAEAGIRFEKHLYPADVAENVLLADIETLNVRPDIDGILVQLPLPSQNPDRVVGAIDPRKDVDGFHPANIEALEAGKPSLAPPVHLGVMKLLESTGADLRGKTAALVCSALFARPLAALLRERGVSSIAVSPDDPMLNDKTRQTDVVMTAVGRPKLITGAMLKPGAIVIDVGTAKVGGKIVGDADRDSVDGIAGFVSPVPGGAGPLTVAYLLLNVLKAAGWRKTAS